MQLANGQVYEELFTKQQQAGLQHAPGKSLQHLHTKGGCGTLQVGLTNGARHSPDRIT